MCAGTLWYPFGPVHLWVQLSQTGLMLKDFYKAPDFDFLADSTQRRYHIVSFSSIMCKIFSKAKSAVVEKMFDLHISSRALHYYYFLMCCMDFFSSLSRSNVQTGLF